MDSTRAYKFRLYPDSKREAEIDLQLILSKNLYNKILEKSQDAYKKDKNFKLNRGNLNKVMREIVSENKDYLKVYSQTRQNIFLRVQKSYQNFFRRCKEKKQGKKVKVGFPRFKSRDRYYSIVYPQDNGAFSIEKDRLRLARIGTMKIELHRQIEGKIKTLTIKREAGKYYAIFTTIKEIKPLKIKDTNPVGIDVGLTTFATLSDGKKITKPKFRNNAQKHIARWQKIVARRKRGSNRRQKAKDRLQKEYVVANNQSENYLHQITNQLVNSGYTSFSVEKLNINNMVKNHRLAGSIQNASWNRFIQFLSYKAESAGLKVVEVNPKNTTKTCSNCGNIQDIDLSERTFLCSRCGMRKDRDLNASINILEKAREGHSRSHAQGDNVRPQREATVRELRTYSAQKEWNP